MQNLATNHVKCGKTIDVDKMTERELKSQDWMLTSFKIVKKSINIDYLIFFSKGGKVYTFLLKGSRNLENPFIRYIEDTGA